LNQNLLNGPHLAVPEVVFHDLHCRATKRDVESVVNVVHGVLQRIVGLEAPNPQAVDLFEASTRIGRPCVR
jgi:hypothetical protein